MLIDHVWQFTYYTPRYFYLTYEPFAEKKEDLKESGETQETGGIPFVVPNYTKPGQCSAYIVMRKKSGRLNSGIL